MKPSKFALESAHHVCGVGFSDGICESEAARLIDASFKPLRESHEELIRETEMLLSRINSENERFPLKELKKRQWFISRVKSALERAQAIEK